jgi:8-oxo-dGTP pyrophosphatase MutT (NUDIX family)
MSDYSPDIPAIPSREQLRAWLESSRMVSASGDAGFADDGEIAVNPPVAPSSVLRPAAVLILIVNRQEQPAVLFTQRTAHLTDHAGQISFPGGRVEDDDRDPAHTALRETEEETGVEASRIHILGTIPQYTTGTGYLVTPVVGWIDPPVQYRPDPTEVAECFEVPFAHVTDPRNHRVESAMYKGRMRSYISVPYGKRYIWGATAGMLVSLTRVLRHAQGGEFQPPVTMAPDSGS